MADSWDSGTRSTVQKLPLLTVREGNAGDRSVGAEERTRESEQNECPSCVLFFFSTPTERESTEKKENFILFPSKQVRAGPRDAKEEWEKRLKEVKRKTELRWREMERER
jgi:hypothetical protein